MFTFQLMLCYQTKTSELARIKIEHVNKLLTFFQTSCKPYSSISYKYQLRRDAHTTSIEHPCSPLKIVGFLKLGSTPHPNFKK